MWMKSQNSESTKPAEIETAPSGVIVRRNFKSVAAAGEMPAHWEWEEWQMTAEQYEVYAAMAAETADLSDALIELADIIAGGE